MGKKTQIHLVMDTTKLDHLVDEMRANYAQFDKLRDEILNALDEIKEVHNDQKKITRQLGTTARRLEKKVKK